jgi:hypothetical protein
MVRKVHIKSGGAAGVQSFEFEGTTFGELKAVVGRAVNFENSTVTDKESRTSFVDDNSVVPMSANVYLMVIPKQMKGGATDRSELYARVRSFREANPDRSSEFQYFTNWTTDALVAKLAEVEGGGQTASTEEVVGIVTEAQEAVSAIFDDAIAKLQDLKIALSAPTVTYGGYTAAQLDAAYADVSAAVGR